jgi:hypothetical protein
MDVRELRIELANSAVRPDAFSINNVGATEEQYRLEKDGEVWNVYYYMNGLRQFNNEDSACEYFLNVLRNDPIARRT